MGIRFLSSQLLIFLLFMLLSAWVYGLYYHLQFFYWWFGALLHLAGGVLVCATLMLFFKRNAVVISGSYATAIYAAAFLGIAALIAIAWELGEFVSDRYILKTEYTFLRGVYEDTLRDLFFGVLGAGLGIIVFRRK